MKITDERETQKKTKTEKNMKRGREAIMKGGELLFFFFFFFAFLFHLLLSLSLTLIIRPLNLGLQTANFARASSLAEQKFA